jgi:hypothetical protein
MDLVSCTGAVWLCICLAAAINLQIGDRARRNGLRWADTGVCGAARVRPFEPLMGLVDGGRCSREHGYDLNIVSDWMSSEVRIHFGSSSPSCECERLYTVCVVR